MLEEIDRKSRIWEVNQRGPGCSPSPSDSSGGGGEVGGTEMTVEKRSQVQLTAKVVMSGRLWWENRG